MVHLASERTFDQLMRAVKFSTWMASMFGASSHMPADTSQLHRVVILHVALIASVNIEVVAMEHLYNRFSHTFLASTSVAAISPSAA